jgi:hypothetical protein
MAHPTDLAPLGRWQPRRSRRDALLAGVLVGVLVAAFALVGSAILITLSVVAIVVGILFSLTVIGLVIGLPLILLGLFGLAGGIVWGSGGVLFALLLGAGCGLAAYRSRLRRIERPSLR